MQEGKLLFIDHSKYHIAVMIYTLAHCISYYSLLDTRTTQFDDPRVDKEQNKQTGVSKINYDMMQVLQMRSCDLPGIT